MSVLCLLLATSTAQAGPVGPPGPARIIVESTTPQKIIVESTTPKPKVSQGQAPTVAELGWASFTAWLVDLVVTRSAHLP